LADDEVVVDARVLVYQVAVGDVLAERPDLDDVLRRAEATYTPASEPLRAQRILRHLVARGVATAPDAVRLGMLVCESAVELRPLWPWDVPRLGQLRCSPSDAHCIALAEALDATFVTLAPSLDGVGARCPVRVFEP
jgi:hypothetical protein